MKKFLLSAAIVAACGSYAFAQETVATLFSGNQKVTWDNTLYFEASNFANVNVGNYIQVSFANTTDVIELKSDGTWLPGSRFIWLGEGTPEIKCYITQDGLATLKSTGLELCGADFTVSEVRVMNDGFNMPEGAVWGGYFWVDNWNTLEIWKNAFARYNGEKYLVVNISEDNGDNTNYIMQVMTAFDNDDAVIGNASKGNETKTNRMTVIDLTDVNLTGMLETADRVLVQANPEGGNPFNITSVVLTNKNPLDEDPAGVERIESENIVDVYSINGILIRKNIINSEAILDLPKGIYILKGQNATKKVVK